MLFQVETFSFTVGEFSFYPLGLIPWLSHGPRFCWTTMTPSNCITFGPVHENVFYLGRALLYITKYLYINFQLNRMTESKVMGL